jgi:hypothetical protein
MISDHTVQLNEQERKMCLAGDMSNCASIPTGVCKRFRFAWKGLTRSSIRIMGRSHIE